MLEKDLLCRSAHWPKFIDSNVGGTGIWSVEFFLDLQPQNDDKSIYATSTASRWLLKTVTEAHGYGIRTARLKNASTAQSTGVAPAPLSSKSVHYLGFYDLEFGVLAKLPMHNYVAEAFWKRENGEDAHFQLQFRQTSSETKANLRKDRRAGLGAIGVNLIGPYRDIAPEDDAYRSQLEQIDLPSLP